MAKMISQNFPQMLFFLAMIIVISEISSCTGSPNYRQEHHHHHHQQRNSSNRDSWPSWFYRRQESSVRNRFLTSGNSERDRYYHSRHRISSRPHSRVSQDALLENWKNRSGSEIATTEMEKTFNDLRGLGNLANETSARRANDKNFSSLGGSTGKVMDSFESRTPRPTTTTATIPTTTTPTTRTSADSSVETSKPEKLTAVAVAEYTGTRAVAYAGYHHHNLDYNPIRSREFRTPGYAIVATSATPSYTKHHAGRRVCSSQAPTSIAHHHRSRQFRLVYTELSASTFLCCPGWSQVSRTSYGCNRPTCALPCLNGGVCGPHGMCNCPKAFTGTQCQIDVDECVTEKPCGQLCTNLPGSYECHCRYGFHLQPDGQSCRQNGGDGTAFEARDLENDYGHTTTITTTETTRRTTPAFHDTENEVGVGNINQDYEIILKRLAKLEKQMARGRKRDTETTEMGTKITQAVESVTAMRRAVDNVQLMQQEIYEMRGKVKQFELESRKLQHLTNRVADLETRLRLRCRNSING